MPRGQAYVESVTVYRSPPLADRVSIVTEERLLKVFGPTTPGDTSAAKSAYACPGGKPPGTLILRAAVNFLESLFAVSALIHEAVHHGQCWAGSPVASCAGEREAYGVQAQWLRLRAREGQTAEVRERIGKDAADTIVGTLSIYANRVEGFGEAICANLYGGR